jgi:hypothetical protein
LRKESRGESGPDAVVEQMHKPIYTFELVLSQLTIDDDTRLLLKPLLLDVIGHVILGR